MGLARGSMTLPRMNAHLLVIIAAALTTMVAAALATALATFSGQALPRAVRHDLSHAPGTTLSISGSVNGSQAAQYNAILPSQIRSALGGTAFAFYRAGWSDPLGFVPGALPATPATPAGAAGSGGAGVRVTRRSPRPPRWAASPARPSWYPEAGPAPRSGGSRFRRPCRPRPPHCCT